VRAVPAVSQRKLRRDRVLRSEAPIAAASRAAEAGRTMALVADSVGLVDELHLIDNSRADAPFRRVAVWGRGDWRVWVDRLPDWMEQLVMGKGKPQ
jgi:hypothetical protein